MNFVVVLSLNFILISAEDTISHGYCELSSKTCTEDIEDVDEQKYLFYDVNPPEGFNLRRDVYMRFAIMLVEAQKRGQMNGWVLVLPPWYNIFHWKTSSHKSKPLPWGHFFDVETMKSYAPVVEMFELFQKFPSKTFEIDNLYVLQNYDDSFENGDFRDKWEVEGSCKYDGHYWGFRNISAKETLCVNFQGHISMLLNLISLHSNDKKVMFSHGEIPLHDSYGTKQYWDCRKSMKFNSDLENIANNYIAKHFNCYNIKCMSYISIHWRRQDFARYRKNEVPSIIGTAKQVDDMIKKNLQGIKNIFIATDASLKEIELLESELNKLGYKPKMFIPTEEILHKYKDGGIAIIDQIICSHAAFFIGTHDSTFSFRIQEERELLGFDSDTTFNRLCPDKGVCEKPSKWTIVH